MRSTEHDQHAWLCRAARVLAFAVVLATPIGVRSQSLVITAPTKVPAGTLVRVTVAATGISDKLPLRWKFPDTKIKSTADTELSFSQAVEVGLLGRSLLFAWPAAGKLQLVVQAGVPIRDGAEIIGFDIVEATATIEQVGGAIGPEPAVPLPRPVPPLDSAVGPITAKLAGNVEVAQDLARFYSAMATAVDRGACGSTGALRSLLVQAAKLSFYGQLIGKTPGLGTEVDRVLAGQLGLDDAALDAARRPQAVAVLRALAWACAEAK